MKTILASLAACGAFLAMSAAASAGPCDAELAAMRSDRPNVSQAGHSGYGACAAKHNVKLDAGPAAAKHRCDAHLAMVRSDRPNVSQAGHSGYASCIGAQASAQ